MKAKVVKKAGAPSLAAAKHLRALFESAAVRQKAHDARLDLQKRITEISPACCVSCFSFALFIFMRF